MNDIHSRKVKTGGDPRLLADYAALRDELAKLSHPARPDVDWGRVEQLSLALFRQKRRRTANGVLVYAGTHTDGGAGGA
ncbi:type VI secretion system ImpA family N-terminal domain-containing protein [Citrobacter murliniae]